MKVVIGIDPDAKKHGVAIYIDGKLTDLLMNDLIELMNTIYQKQMIEFDTSVVVHIENVCANNAAFGKKHVANTKAATNIKRTLGMCQQAQVEVERMCAHLDIEVVHHKISSKWKNPKHGKAEFERLTGWTGRSNEDSRSAAWFGFLGSR